VSGKGDALRTLMDALSVKGDTASGTMDIITKVLMPVAVNRREYRRSTKVSTI
jgi:hypothetical protein